MLRYNSKTGAIFNGTLAWYDCAFSFQMWYEPVAGGQAKYGIRGTGTGSIKNFVKIKGLEFAPRVFE